MGSGPSRAEEVEIWRMRDHYLDMALEEKRKQYPGYHVTLDDLKVWQNYFIEEITDTERHRDSPYNPDDEINSKVLIWQGDITQLEVDAIINSAARPQQRGLVNQAIIEQAGEWYVRECCLNGLQRAKPGDVMVTGGYRLPAKYVMNTLAPRNHDQEILRKCYINCLNTARTLNLKNIAFPCIGTGKKRGRFSADAATELALGTVREWLDSNHTKMERVIFCVFDASTHLSYRRFMQKYFPIRGYCSSTNVKVLATPRISVNEAYDPANETGLNLEDWRDNIFVAEPHEISVTRGNPESLVKQLMAIYQEDCSLLCREPVIHFKGEDGVDQGGLTNEYFFEALELLTHMPIQGSPLFEGEGDHVLPCPAKVHINLYNIVGRVLAHSILHYGIGLCGVSRAIVYLLTHDVSRDQLDTSMLPLTIRDVTDMDLRSLLQKKTADELSTDEKMTLQQYMVQAGIGSVAIDESSFETVKQEVMMDEVFYRRWPQIEAIRQGMDVFGLYRFLCLNPCEENVKEVFPTCDDLRVTPQMLLCKLTLEGPGGDGWEYFKRLLDDLHSGTLEGLTLSTLLVFWTGQPCLSSTSLTAEVDPVTSLPQASTCFQRLFIPGACSSYGQFSDAFRVALNFGAKGFGEM